FQCARSTESWPRMRSSGSRNSVAPATRTAASATGPNSAAPMRMKRNEPPHSAARAISSPRSDDFKTTPCGSDGHALERKQRALAIDAAGIAGEVAVVADHAMARHDDRHRVLADRAADR